MKFVKLFEKFKETTKNTPLLYKDENVEVKVVKTFDSSRDQGKDTSWCSNSKIGYYKHSMTANMYRFNFKDGYKLRLTWDYITQKASHLGDFAGGTHWGQGGIVDGEYQYYDVLRPENDSDPFYINWESATKREIVDRIKSIPKEAISIVNKYQKEKSKEKSENISRMYKDIENIKIIGIDNSENRKYWLNCFLIKISYLGIEYEIELLFNAKNDFRLELGYFDRKLKNKYMLYGKALGRYIFDKSMDYCKKNNISIKKKSK